MSFFYADFTPDLITFESAQLQLKSVTQAGISCELSKKPKANS